MIPPETIRRIKDAADIVDIISRCGVDLKKRGARYQACCPFHNERTASFTISVRDQSFKCWGASCGEHGDVIQFLMKYRNQTFQEALRDLAGMTGLTHILPPNSLGGQGGS